MGNTWGGTLQAWSSWRTAVPLVLGFLGLRRFMWYQESRWFGLVVVSTIVRRSHKTNADSHENKNKVKEDFFECLLLFSTSFFLFYLICKISGPEPLKTYLNLSALPLRLSFSSASPSRVSGCKCL